jgi:hypothetical protein
VLTQSCKFAFTGAAGLGVALVICGLTPLAQIETTRRRKSAFRGDVRHLPTPFGGMKPSGIGRDGRDYSFDFDMETNHVSLAKEAHGIQRLGFEPGI